MKISHLLLAVAMLPAGAFAQTISPAAPKDRDSIYLELPANYLQYQYYFVGTTMEAMKITAWFEEAGAYFPVGPATSASRIPLGQLPAGDYSVELVIRNQGGRGAIPFRVASRTHSQVPMHNYTDMWWNPQESGWGISIHQHASDGLFAVWFVYGDDHKPQWYVVPGGTWERGSMFSGPVYRTSGPAFRGVFDPAQVGVAPVGTAILDFFSGDGAQFRYTIDGVAGSKVIQRQPF
jgi:hypothetical protein